MKLKSLILAALFPIPASIWTISGQDSLIINNELKMKRFSDSVNAFNYYIKAEEFLQSNDLDSTLINIEKSLAIATSGDFPAIEACNYELLGSFYNRQADWEGTLRYYLKALSLYERLNDYAKESSILRSIANWYYRLGIYKKSADYFERESALYGEDNLKMLGASSEMAANSYYNIPYDTLAVKWFRKASGYYKKNGDMDGFLRCSEKLASLYIQEGLYNDALETYRMILPVYSEKGDFQNIAAIYNQTGFLLIKMNDPDAALTEFQMAAEYSLKEGKDDFFLTDVWSNTGICYQNLGKQNEMLESFEMALESAKKSGRTDEVARIDRILGRIYFIKGDNYHAELYCLNCIEAASVSGNLDVLQECYKDYSDVLARGNDYYKALDYYEKHLNLRDSLNFESRIAEKENIDRQEEYEATEQRISSELSREEIQQLEIKTLKAESSRKENELKLLMNERALDRSEKERLEQSLALEKERFELGLREQEVRSLEQQREIQLLEIKQKNDSVLLLQQTNQLLEKDKIQKETELRNEKMFRKMAVGIGSLMVLVATSILFGLISTRRKNQKLAESKRQIEKINSDLEVINKHVLEQNEKISQQKDIIEQKNQSITESIQYAGRIQTAVLPPVDFLNALGFDNFILYKPKDIVSGDFYWGKKKKERIVLAAGDCTGHGVPGAFMSMLGLAFLDEIVNTVEVDNAAEILNLLRDEVISTLRQKGIVGETRDGMDISLCILDLNGGRLQFAGANNPLYLIRDNKLTKIQADRMPIGIHFTSFSPFTNNLIDISKGDFLCLFTDGYADQFGGSKGRKFMYRPFQKLLIDNHAKPVDLQKDILDKTFEEWKGDRDQVDDVLVIGLKI